MMTEEEIKAMQEENATLKTDLEEAKKTNKEMSTNLSNQGKLIKDQDKTVKELQRKNNEGEDFSKLSDSEYAVKVLGMSEDEVDEMEVSEIKFRRETDVKEKDMAKTIEDLKNGQENINKTVEEANKNSIIKETALKVAGGDTELANKIIAEADNLKMPEEITPESMVGVMEKANTIVSVNEKGGEEGRANVSVNEGTVPTTKESDGLLDAETQKAHKEAMEGINNKDNTDNFNVVG